MSLHGIFVTGTDTDAGKTVAAAGLLRALRQAGSAALGVKPVQTGVTALENGQDAGTAKNADASRYADALRGLAPDPAACVRTLRCFSLPASPHLAAREEGATLNVAELAAQVRGTVPAGAAAPCAAPLVVEGAGGALVPLNERESMLDLMEALQLPVLVVARNRLGMVNHALLTVQAVLMRGLRLAGVACVHCAPEPEDAGQVLLLRDNAAFLRAHADVPQVWEIPYEAALAAPQAEPCPSGAACAEAPAASAVSGPSCARGARGAGGASAAPSARAAAWDAVAAALRPLALQMLAETPSAMAVRQDALDVPQWDARHLWHPYTSATRPLPVLEAARTAGTRIILRDGRELVDGMASWWCAIHGYGNARLVRAAREQAGRMAHVMFGGLTHAPAVRLGQKLLPLLPEGLEHIFWADSGSVAVEVALKMALQYQQSLERPQAGTGAPGRLPEPLPDQSGGMPDDLSGPHGPPRRTRILAPLGGYHGDTFGAMSVCDPVNGMHGLFRGMLARQVFVPRPSCRFDAPFDPACMEPVAAAMAAHGHELAAAILEPVVQGAGGMWLYHPEYLTRLRALCDAHGVLLIFDEIATGFGRTGKMFAAQWAGVSPDILCLGKALTGGFMTLAGTACTARVARGISAGGNVFMHGPTFMGNPLACAVAEASLDELLASPWQENVARLERGLRAGLAPCAGQPGVADVRVLGGIGVVETQAPVPVAALQKFFVEQGVWIRPFARLIYLMPPYTATEDDISVLTRAVVRAVKAGVHLA